MEFNSLRSYCGVQYITESLRSSLGSSINCGVRADQIQQGIHTRIRLNSTKLLKLCPDSTTLSNNFGVFLFLSISRHQPEETM